MGQHGFARDNEFVLESKTDEEIWFSFSSNEETLKKYPFEFKLRIGYKIVSSDNNYDDVQVMWEVINPSDKTMYFSIGAHPGFNCKIGDWLEFEENETLTCEKIDTDSILDGKFYPTLKDSKRFDITADVFADDAHILSGMKSDTVYLKSDFRPQVIKFNFGKVPYLGLWAKPGAEYVCIEPWYGLNDSREKKDDFSQKRGIQKISGDEEFIFPWSAEIIE